MKNRRRVYTSVRWIQNTEDFKKGTLWLTASVYIFGTRFAYTLPLYVDLNGLSNDIKKWLESRKKRVRSSR